MTCGTCDSVYYAHSTPAVAAALVRDGKILLARRANEPFAGRWDTPGGFVDAGEDPREALRRELREETGLEIEVGSFRGAFSDTYGDGAEDAPVLNLVWDARVVSGDGEPADDVSELRWFGPEELPPDEEFAFRWVAPFMRDWAGARAPTG
jgi:8-oxo-dGTP diphosphatase